MLGGMVAQLRPTSATQKLFGVGQFDASEHNHVRLSAKMLNRSELPDSVFVLLDTLIFEYRCREKGL